MTVKSFIVTQKEDTYKLIEESILQQYSIKEDNTTPQSKDVTGEDYDYPEFRQPQYNLKKLCELIDNNTYHRRCCEVVAEDGSGYSYSIIPSDSKQDMHTPEMEKQYEYINNFLEDLYTPINTTLYRYCYDKRAMGCACIEIIRRNKSDSEIVDLNHIAPYYMRIHRDNCRVLQRIGRKKRWFTLYGQNYTPDGVPFDVNCETGEICEYNSLPSDLRANELLWGVDYAPHTPYYGSAKVIPVIKTIFGDLGRSRYNTSFFQNYGMPSYAVTVTGDFDVGAMPGDDDYDPRETLQYKIKQQMEEAVLHPHSAFAMLIPSSEGNVDVKFTPLNVEGGGEASFRLYRADNRDEVLAAHGVPPYRLGLAVTGSLGGSTSEESSNIYTTSIIQPLKKKNEDLINNLIQQEYTRFYQDKLMWKFKIEEIDKRDYSKDLDNALKLFSMGAITPRQVGELLGGQLEAVPDGDYDLLDEYFVNGTPLKVLCNSNSESNLGSTLDVNDSSNDDGDLNSSTLKDNDGTEISLDERLNDIQVSSIKSEKNSISDKLKDIFKS